MRRGLAAQISTPDPIATDLPAHARLPVRLTLSTGPQVGHDLQLYGPGDVTGLDTRAIVRIEPRRGTTNFAPDQFATIEFDPPDLPWLLTPVRAGTNDRLRPWLALVVVAVQPGVRIDATPDHPLPRLIIEDSASPDAELPDLTESWAWAHAHMVEPTQGGSVTDRLSAEPDLNVSRLVCPRRLQPDSDYIACLVPATEAGRRAGLGGDPGDAATTGPAWTSVDASVTLPMYYHWEFRTGPAGDFESLARKLVARPIPPTVGRRPMFVGVDPELPTLAPDAGGVLGLEGALRAPDSGADDPPPPADELVDALIRVLDAPAEHILDGAPDDAESVSPPIYGQWAVRQHTVPATPTARPRWLRDLNIDPRNRAAAGLGAQIVRENQERFVSASWQQVGDVLDANRLLDRARLMARVVARVHARHVAPLGDDSLLALAAPVHDRMMIEGQTVQRRISASLLPSGTGDPAFRRMAAPQARGLRRAARLAGADGDIAPPTLRSDLARGTLVLDLLGTVPDGIKACALVAQLPSAGGGQVSGAGLGLSGQVAAVSIAELGDLRANLDQQPPSSLVLRANIALTGVITDRQLEMLASTIGATGSVHKSIGQIIPRAGRVTAEVGSHGLAGGTRPHNRSPGDPRLPVSIELPDGTTRDVESPLELPASVSAFVGAFEAQRKAFEPKVIPLRPAPAPVELSDLRAGIVAALDPTPVIDRRTRAKLSVAGVALGDANVGDRIRVTDDYGPVMAGPIIPEALYRDLADYDQDRFLPGAGTIPSDTVTLLETNPRFVEAFLIGANHEMNRELLWRGYPTDRRGTPLRRFWDRLDIASDIGPIHEFSSAARLGSNALGQLTGSLVLLVRGELLRRYPNSVVYAVPAAANGRLDPAAPITTPVFGGRLEPDLTFVGFDLTEEQVEPAPGWFFVIAEQPAEPRFGLDVPSPTSTGQPSTWADLDYSHVGIAPGQYLRLTGQPLAGTTLPLASRSGPAASVGAAEFGRNSAHMAAITFQRPFRAAMHSSQMLAGVRGGDG